MATPTHTTPSGVNAPAYPDAELIRICDEVADLNRQTEALDDVDDANFARWRELSALAATMPAETLDGVRARLRAIGPGTLQDNLLGSTMGELKAQMIALADELIRFAVGHTGTPEELRDTVAQNPDAELIATCGECERLELEMLGLFEGPREIPNDKERDAAIEASGNDERARELAKVIASTPATTMAGLRAKARAAVASYPSILEGDQVGNAIETSILCDLVGDYDPIALVGGVPA